MTDGFKSKIERLLDEPRLSTASPEADLARAQLAATVAKGLADAPSSVEKSDAGDIASTAAFIDGKLTGEARDKFVARLAQREGLRADVESASALVTEISEKPRQVPPHLLARAAERLASERPRQVTASPRWSLSALLPQRRIAWAMMAAILVMAVIPAGLTINRQFGRASDGNEPELSSVPEPQDAVRQACEDKLKKEAEAAKRKGASVKSKQTSAPDASKDPCDTTTLGGAGK